MQQPKPNNLKVAWLVALRLAIGWHFLYEGLIKVLNPNWSSIGYLLDSKGFMSSFFYGIANNPTSLNIADFMNQWGLVLIGLGLILGFLTRISAISGMLLLALYYLSHPPFYWLEYAMPTEGSYFFIDKVFIEFCALGAIASMQTGKCIGIDRLLFRKES